MPASANSVLSEDEAMKLVVQEVQAVRRKCRVLGDPRWSELPGDGIWSDM